MPTIPTAEQSDYSQALHDLLGLLLGDLYKAADTQEQQDDIIDEAGDVHDVITQLNQGALDSDSGQFAALKKQVDGVNKELKDMKDQIDNWVKDVGIATQVVNAIDQVLNTAAKVFTL
jgi:hypothetical protein